MPGRFFLTVFVQAPFHFSAAELGLTAAAAATFSRPLVHGEAREAAAEGEAKTAEVR
jgi:hypothetical protein